MTQRQRVHKTKEEIKFFERRSEKEALATSIIDRGMAIGH